MLKKMRGVPVTIQFEKVTLVKVDELCKHYDLKRTEIVNLAIQTLYAQDMKELKQDE